MMAAKGGSKSSAGFLTLLLLARMQCAVCQVRPTFAYAGKEGFFALA